MPGNEGSPVNKDSDRQFDRYLRAFLSVTITMGFFGVIVALFVIPIPPTTKDILLVMLGALLASYKEITGYSFGSSSGSTAKGADQAASLAAKDAILAASSVTKDTALAAAAMPRISVTDPSESSPAKETP
jgi:hypothetical protein